MNSVKLPVSVSSKWQTVVHNRPFSGCVNHEDCNPSSHGGVQVVQVRKTSKRYEVRMCNVNGWHDEDGRACPATLVDGHLYW